MEIYIKIFVKRLISFFQVPRGKMVYVCIYIEVNSNLIVDL